ncbi:tetratricopeptide repeat domain protein [Verrucomicrobiia bacterium DG1235]|nr:tetratricopeptide repeat domain protein [Verrucomicrobiae bacterium DG1235]
MESHHAGANRLVDLEKDAARFSVGEFEDAAGRRYKAEADGDRLLISERNADGEFVSAQAKAVIGKTPLQQPLVEGPRGRLQAHAMAWDPEKLEWFNVFGSEERLSGEWGHWTGQGMNWNSNCAWCHTTEYQKGYDPLKDAYESSWTHQGISCIACHSGMEEHVANAGNDDYLSPAKPSPRAMMENCASCHARREELTDGGFEAGDSFEDHYRLMLYDHPTAYFPDGKANEENFVFGSLMHSRMGHAGVSCMDCHDPHSNELKLPADSNATCIQCHSTGKLDATIIDLSTHSRHPLGSTGDSCVNCHMPERTYMARDPRRDHGFTIPDPYMKKTFNTPDACTTCHQDLSTDELLTAFNSWYGDAPRVTDLRDRAHLLVDAWNGELESPDAILKRLSEETNPYWQASWLRMLRGFTDRTEVLDAAMNLLGSKHAIARDAAVLLIGSRSDGLKLLELALTDSKRIVRMQAADTLAGSPYLSVEIADEYENYLKASADRPSGALKLASKAAREGDAQTALHHGELAISFDRKNAPIRYDVAILLDRVGMGEEAIRHLRITHGYDSNSGLYLYSMGLVMAAQGRLEDAADAIKQGLAIEPEQHRWLYNLSVVQTRLGDVAAARSSLENALQLSPGEAAYEDFLRNLNKM